MSVLRKTDATRSKGVADDFGYVCEEDAARLLGVETSTLVRYRKQGLAPKHARVARTVAYSRDALAAWLAAGGTNSRKK